MQITAALVQDDADVQEGLKPSPEAAAGPPGAAGDRPQTPVVGRVQMQDPVGFAIANRAEHDRLGLQRAGHEPRTTTAILFEAMRDITVYTTDHCSLCTSAKTLLERRGIPYQEVNLARDPDGRAKLQSVTGMLSFPQIVIDGETIGGFTELVRADREGRLSDLMPA